MLQSNRLLRLVVLPTTLFYLVLCALVVFKNGQFSLLDGSPSYSKLAEHLASGGSFQSGYRPPLYPLLLSYFMRCFGNYWEAAVLVSQAILGLLSTLFLMLITWRIAKTSLSGILAGALFLSHITLQLEIVTLRETALFVFLLVCFFWFCTRHFDREGTRQILLGLITALAHLTRPTGIILVPIILLFPFLSKNGGFIDRIKGALLAFTVFAAAVAPWQFALWQMTDKISPTSSTSNGLNLLKGNNPQFETLFPVIEIDDYEQYLTGLEPGIDLTDQATDTSFKEHATSYIKSNPALFAQRALSKAVMFLSPIPLPLASATIEVGPTKSLEIIDIKYRNSLLLMMMGGFSLILIGGIILYLFLNLPGKSQPAILMIGVFAILLSFIHAITFPESRFRYPLDTIACIVAGIGWSGLLKRPQGSAD